MSGVVDSANRGALVREYHRPRNRPRALRRSASVKGATGRRSATSAPPKHQPRKARTWRGTRTIPRPSLKKGSWVECQRFRRSAVEYHRPDATDRRRCEGERQCGGNTDRRSVPRAVIAKELIGTRTAGGSREGSPGQRTARWTRVPFLSVFWRK